jgi:hypothetical protein
MLAAETITPGYTPQPTLVFGQDFNCTSTICYGIGANHTTFLTLQGFVNKFANAVGFRPIAVDGKLGDGTVAAFRKVVAWVLQRAGHGTTWKVGSFDAASLERTQMAMYALELIKNLDYWADAASAARWTLPPPIVASSSNALPATLPSPPITAVPMPDRSTSSLPTLPLLPATIRLPDLTKPSAGAFGPAQTALTVTPSPTPSAGPLGLPWWVWIVSGVVLVGGTTAAVVLTRRRRKVA